MYKKTLKRNKGITLIALVVTIIVLLILVGIVIMMLTGQNGILNRASEARDMTGTAQEEEQVKLLAMEVTTQTLNIHDNLTQDILDKAIKNQFGKEGGEGEIISDGYNVTVKKTGNVYQIKDGVVEKVPNKEDLKVDEHPGELEKVGEHIWQINSIEDLVALSYEVASGQNSYEGETVELGRDLWFTGEFNSYRNEDAIYVEDDYGYKPDNSGKATIKEFMIEKNGFLGIGQKNNPYKGSFDGKEHAIYGTRLYSKDLTCGLFGTVETTDNIEFKNLSFCLQKVGGGVSKKGIIGEILGDGNAKVKNMINKPAKEKIKVYGGSLGGIVGCVSGNINIEIEDCIDEEYSELSCSTSGGIIATGKENAKIRINNCISKENLSGYSYTGGGIVGELIDNAEINISNCKNVSNLEDYSKGSEFGGIVGNISCKNFEVIGCENKGIFGENNSVANLGGIIGRVRNENEEIEYRIIKCNNYVNIINSTEAVGERAGRNYSRMLWKYYYRRM